ncbi:MFS family permease [Paraburkholderia youngii]
MDSGNTMKAPGLRRLLVDSIGPVAAISLAQLFGTALWFSANSTAADLMKLWHASAADIGWLTNAVQLGFILGTLIISLSSAADRFRASSIFVCSALAGAILKSWFCVAPGGARERRRVPVRRGRLSCRDLSDGDEAHRRLGAEAHGSGIGATRCDARAGYGATTCDARYGHGHSVAAHHLCVISAGCGRCDRYWDIGRRAAFCGQGARASGGVAPAGTQSSVIDAFRIPSFRAATFGYFGHMWELYTFWIAVPLLVSHSSLVTRFPAIGVPAMSFAIIGMGAVGSLAGGVLSRHIGSAKVATGALAISGFCCLTFALGWRFLSPDWLALLMAIWGATVVADSPQFSALAARACPPDLVGSALAIQNSIGFAVTVVSIAITTSLFERVGLDATWLPFPGPVLGLAAFAAMSRHTRASVRTFGMPRG